MADPDEALIEAIAEAIQLAIENEPAHMTETGALVVSGLPRCYAFPMSEKAARAVAENLGLVEERKIRYLDSGGGIETVYERRLVSRWVEVDHGSE